MDIHREGRVGTMEKEGTPPETQPDRDKGIKTMVDLGGFTISKRATRKNESREDDTEGGAGTMDEYLALEGDGWVIIELV